jgi:hypothetical protein
VVYRCHLSIRKRLDYVNETCMSANLAKIYDHFYMYSFTSLCLFHRMCYQSNATGVISAPGTAYPSWAHEFTLGVRVHFVQLHVLVFFVPCDVRCNFCVKQCSVPLCSHLFCMWLLVILVLLGMYRILLWCNQGCTEFYTGVENSFTLRRSVKFCTPLITPR